MWLLWSFQKASKHYFVCLVQAALNVGIRNFNSSWGFEQRCMHQNNDLCYFVHLQHACFECCFEYLIIYYFIEMNLLGIKCSNKHIWRYCRTEYCCFSIALMNSFDRPSQKYKSMKNSFNLIQYSNFLNWQPKIRI